MTDREDFERLKALEVEVQNLAKDFAKIEGELSQVNTKLDNLLEFKNKGMGAFWLVSALVGSGLIGIVTSLIDWIKG